MATFLLVLTWVSLGLFTDVLCLAAGFKLASWGKPGRLWLLVAGLCASLLGGLLGLWLFGRLFSSATALWLAVLVACLPALYARGRKRLAGGRISSRSHIFPF